MKLGRRAVAAGLGAGPADQERRTPTVFLLTVRVLTSSFQLLTLHPHVQFIYFLMPLTFASLLGLLCLLHHKVRSSAFETLRKLAHQAPVDLFEENKRRLPKKKKKF